MVRRVCHKDLRSPVYHGPHGATATSTAAVAYVIVTTTTITASAATTTTTTTNTNTIPLSSQRIRSILCQSAEGAKLLSRGSQPRPGFNETFPLRSKDGVAGIRAIV
ncbi:uncharacterized protein LOC135098308 isoform X1 [Scylla paramamosain]|uniref:uncharacterized protein LOC135098308 isoform X1 n=1 Tax=Scylla paramamosain TaxID=85552 RepID=UPI003082ED88